MTKSYLQTCRGAFFWLKETLMHPGVNRAWRMCAACDTLSRTELASIQRAKLQKVLAHAATTVPYYKRYFEQHPISVETLQLTDFPIIEKKDIRGHEDEFLSDKPSGRVAWSRTSGSTGEPFRFGRSEFDYTYATLWRGLLRFGIRPGDKRVLVKGVDETPNLSLKTRIRRKLYGWLNRCIVVDAHFLAKSEANIVAELNRIMKYRPNYFHGYVSSIYLLARTAEEKKIDLASLHVKAIVTESEKCHSFQRELMERVFNAPVIENYGCVEFGMIAQPATDGAPCINEDHVVAETDADGNAVFTNLDEFSFPLIRFRNGDQMSLGPVHNSLPYRTIAKIDGRKTEMIRLPNGGALQGFIVMHPLYKHTSHIKAYQVYQSDERHLVIRIVTADVFPDGLLEQIIAEMREIVGEDMVISHEFLSEIPLSKRGKRLFIISDVK